MGMKQLQAVADRTATILTVISAALLAVMFLTNIAQIVLRPITGGLIWVNDLSRLLFAWVIMLGAAAAFGKHEHLIVDVLVNIFPRRTRTFTLILSRVLQVGVGALLVRRGVTLGPAGFGGGQEARLRSGTVPAALAVGFAVALHSAVERREAEAARLAVLGERLAAGIAAIPGTRVNTTPPASPAILNVTVDGTRADDLLLILDAAGIDCSTGSACTAGVHQPSEVLLAMGRDLAAASGSLRFSFGPDTDDQAIDAVLAVLPQAVERARLAYAGSP